jgi:hypothetical protein
VYTIKQGFDLIFVIQSSIFGFSKIEGLQAFLTREKAEARALSRVSEANPEGIARPLTA